MKNPQGRPSDYTEEMASSICDRLSVGESLSAICRSEGFPAKTAVLRWLARHESFRTQYRYAKEASQDAVAEEIFDILDEMPMEKPDGSLDAAAVTWAKNRADARKWYLSKIAPKKYGDKIQQEIGGIDGAPMHIGIEFVSSKK
jgi:hypothetical protein